MLRNLLFLAVLASGTNVQAALSVTFHAWNEQCSNNNGRIEAMASGGQLPYTYAWDNGGTTDVLQGLDAGTYTLTLTDDLGAQVVQAVTIVDVPNIQIPDHAWNTQTMGNGFIVVSMAGTRPCTGQCNGGYAWSEISYTPNLIGPVTYWPEPTETQAFGPVFATYCAGDMPVLEITDASGCSATFPIEMIEGTGSLPMSIASVEAACGPTGSITLNEDQSYGTLRLLDAAYQPTGFSTQTWAGMGQTIISDLLPGDYLVERVEDLTFYDCPEYLAVTVPSLGSPCGTVSGKVYLDHDQDCSQDGNDEPLALRVLEVLPGPQYTITDWNGHYDLGLIYGNFTIDQQIGADMEQLCPGVAQVPFTIDAVTSDVTVDFADSNLVPLDVEALISVGALRPGFAVNIWGGVHNLSGQLTGPLDITMILDPVLSFVSAQPPPTSVVGSTIIWSGIDGLSAFGGHNVNVVAQAPPDVALIGTDATFTISVSQPLSETTLANNSTSRTRTFTGSYDPNEKTVRTSSGTSGSEYIIGTDEFLDYTIQFQNTGTDTAFTVVVTDTLSEDLDMASFQQGLASHPFDVSFKDGRVVEWRFVDIQLPDSNVNETGSHGLVCFRIKPVQPLLPGTEISNTANIYFDFNEPVITEPSVLTAELSTGVPTVLSGNGLEVFPNPTTGSFTLRLPEGSIRSVQLLSADGRLLLQEGTAGGPSIIVDAAMLAPGTYFVVVTSEAGEQLRTRFTKH